MSNPRVSGVITLLTDFGVDHPFVGVMKGVILRRFAAARIVDLAHGIGPQDVVEASFWLSRSYAWFPEGTVHVAVIDPGVGSARGTLALAAGGHYFIGPDNGLFGEVLDAAPADAVHSIDTHALGLPEPSHTFHGRDVFAPAAAELASGRRRLSEIGPEKSVEVARVAPVARAFADRVEGSVVSVDHFGNLITNVDATLIASMCAPELEVGSVVRPVRATYAEADVGDYAGVVNSFGTLELAQRDGHAARSLGLSRGARVVVHDRKRAP
jgi:S-adenosyl-L-methionine hydrolase (adenosine-forming)